MSEYIHPGALLPDLAFGYLGERMRECKSLLDIGGGSGIVGRDAWRIRGVGSFVVLDAWEGYKQTNTDFVCGRAQDLLDHFDPGSFDIVQCCETIEHLEKEEGHKLLQDMKKVARCFVILTCPRGFQEQDPNHDLCKNEPWANNPYQLHKSGWEPSEFFNFGYSMYYNPENNPGCQLVPYWINR